MKRHLRPRFGRSRRARLTCTTPGHRLAVGPRALLGPVIILLVLLGGLAGGAAAAQEPTTAAPPGQTGEAPPTDPNIEAAPPLAPTADDPAAPTGEAAPGAAAKPVDAVPAAGTTPAPAGPPARAVPTLQHIGKGKCRTGEPAKGLPAWIVELNETCWDTGGNFWLPTPAAKEADSDFMFYAVLGLSIFCFIGITVVTVVFVIKYRARPGHKAQPSASHNDTMEITWTVIPTIITVFLFVGGWNGYLAMNTRAAEPITIKVTAKQWSWDFEYPNGLHLSDLVVPVGRDIELQMTSVDVLHSFFVPNFRVKSDVVPRRYTFVHFHPTRTGVYRLYCTEYCGKDHSLMKNKAIVLDHMDWQQYLTEYQGATSNMDPVEVGKMVFSNKGCNGCHTVDGSPKVGPSWKGTWGKDVPLADGTTVPYDAQYVKTAVQDPAKQIRSGFPNGMAPQQLSEAEINGVAAYIESLK